MLQQRQNQRDQKPQQPRHQHQQKLKSWHGDRLCLHHLHHHHHPFHHACLRTCHRACHPTSSFRPLPHHPRPRPHAHAHARPHAHPHLCPYSRGGGACWTSSEACPLGMERTVRWASMQKRKLIFQLTVGLAFQDLVRVTVFTTTTGGLVSTWIPGPERSGLLWWPPCPPSWPPSCW